MTTLTTPAQPRQHTPRPVPWSKLAWVSWRQYRVALLGAVSLLGVLALYLLIMGLRIRSGYASVASCAQLGGRLPNTCETALMLFGGYHVWGETTAAVLIAVPMLIGAFAGAPILGRELEAGTFRFTWTQGAGRTRWALARLALPAVTVTAVAAALSQLFGWFYYPFFATGDSALTPQLFEQTGIAFAAWTLAAFAIGTLAGVLIRKVVPAIAAAMAAWAGLLLITSLYLRQLYQAPLNVHSGGHGAPGASPWVISQWWTGPNGKPVPPNTLSRLIQGVPAGSTKQVGPNSSQTVVDPFRWLAQHGYSQWTTYEPGTRYWHFQFIEAGWLLALSLLLIAAAIWLVRRRAA